MECDLTILRKHLATGSLEAVKACLGQDDFLNDFHLQRKALKGVTLLHLAAEFGRVDVVEHLINDAKCPIDVVDCRQGPALLEAAAAGQIATIEWFVANGANLHVADERGDTALHVAAGHGQLDTVKWLLEHGCKVDAVTKKGITPFLYAAAKGKVLEMKELYRAGGDMRAIDVELGWSVAHITAACNHSEALKWVLVHQPAMVNWLSKSGERPIDVATSHKATNAYVLLQRLQKTAKKSSRRQQRLSKRRQQSRLESEAGKLAAKEADAIFLEVFKEESEISSSNVKKKTNNQRASTSRKGDPCQEKQQVCPFPETESSESEVEGIMPEAFDKALQPINTIPSGDSSCRSEDERKEESNGEWTVKLSRREKRRKTAKTAHAKNRKVLYAKRDDRSGLSNNDESISKTEAERTSAMSCKQSSGTSKSSTLAVPNSKLRPTAAPWSPRRKSWNPGEGKKKSDNANEESGEAVQSEFDRMLKKFVHIDAGARRAAKRRFAKASALYEERRVAVAEKVESAWRVSLCSRLSAAIASKSKVEIRSVLMEIKSAQEERTLHENSSPECSHATTAQVCDFLSTDTELKALVDTSRKLLLKLDPPPLKHLKPSDQPESRHEAMAVRAIRPDYLLVSVTSPVDFQQKLEASMGTWDLLGLEKISLQIALGAVECIPLAVKFKFDFESAGPGYCIMTTKY